MMHCTIPCHYIECVYVLHVHITDNIYAYAWIGNVHSNYIEMRETILVILQCHNNLRKIECRTVAEKWSSFIVVAIFETYLVCF